MLVWLISACSAAEILPGKVAVQSFQSQDFTATAGPGVAVLFPSPAGRQLLETKFSQAKWPISANFSTDCLTAHNAVRSLVNVGNLTWSPSLANSAQQWAQYLAYNNQIRPSGGQYGENLFMIVGGDLTCSNAVKLWFAGFRYYNGEYIPYGQFNYYGTFTQVAWPKTTQVGCATAKVPTQFGPRQSVVCQYSPPGNIQGAGVSYVIAA